MIGKKISLFGNNFSAQKEISNDFINKVILGDSAEVLKSIPDNSIDLVITSPPYKDVDNFSFDLIHNVFKEVKRVLKPNSLLFLNFGHLAGFKSRPFKVALVLEEELGFNWQETFTWVKNHFSPCQGKKRVNNLTEFVFMFSKGECPELDRLSIGVEYIDQSNAKRFNNGLNKRCAGNFWPINYKTIQSSSEKPHPDRFPVELPQRCIKLSNIKQREKPIVLDCFGGSASTAIAAIIEGVDFTLIEKQEKYFNFAQERIKNGMPSISVKNK